MTNLIVSVDPVINTVITCVWRFCFYQYYFFFPAIDMGEIEVEPIADLETVRNLVDKLELNGGPPKDHAGNAMPKLSSDWCFVDCA